MNDFDIKFFPAETVKNNHLGGGYIRSGVFSVRFSVWLNDKFSQGFSIQLPYSKTPQGEIRKDVDFGNREMSDAIYNAVAPQVSGLVGGGTGGGNAAPKAQANTFASKPAAIVRQEAPAAGTGSPKAPW
jgi:hypothetical protein